jgi:hypothetical protein
MVAIFFMRLAGPLEGSSTYRGTTTAPWRPTCTAQQKVKAVVR